MPDPILTSTPAAQPAPAPAAAPAAAPDIKQETKTEQTAWPDSEKILNDIKAKKSAPPVEPPKTGNDAKPGDQKPGDQPPAKTYAKPETLLTDVIEGLDPEEFKGKTVKDFVSFITQVESEVKELETTRAIKDILDNDEGARKAFFEYLEKNKTPAAEAKKGAKTAGDEIPLGEDDTPAIPKEADDRIKKLEEKFDVREQAEETEALKRNVSSVIEASIAKHTDPETKAVALTEQEIKWTIDLAKGILDVLPGRKKYDIPKMVSSVLDKIAESKKEFSTASVASALAKAKPQHIMEYLGLKIEQQKQFLESLGQSPAPAIKQDEPPSGDDLKTGKVFDRALQFVMEKIGKK